MKSGKSMRGGNCNNCNCGKRGGAYGGHSALVGSPLTMKGGAKKSMRKLKRKRGGSKKSIRKRVKRGGSYKCPGFKLNLKEQILGRSVVDRYETCDRT